MCVLNVIKARLLSDGFEKKNKNRKTEKQKKNVPIYIYVYMFECSV